MSTDISNVQAQPGAATVRETVIVPGPIRDGPDRRLAIGELVKDSHASGVTHKRGDQIVERESSDTALNLKLNACKSTNFGKTRFSITRDLSSETDLFYRVIEIYQKSSKGNHLPPDFDIRKAHSWDEVHQAASLAEAEWKKDGTQGIFSKIGRGIQRSAPAVEPWLGLIPDGDYTSVLCGGLKIAFGVAGQMQAQREQIFETFQQIPRTVRLAEDRLKEWPNDETLHNAATELYLAVLTSIEAMIIWLVDTSALKKLGQILKKPKVEKTNSFYLNDVQNEVKRLEDRAVTLKNKAIVRTDTSVEKIRLEVEAIKISTQSTKRMMVQELSPVMNETRNLVRETRLIMDVYAKATRSDTQASDVGIRNHRSRFVFYLRWHVYSAGRTFELIDQKRMLGPEMWQKMNSSFHLIDRVADIVAEEWRAVPCMYESIRNSENISLVSWDPSTKLLILGEKRKVVNLHGIVPLLPKGKKLDFVKSKL